MINSIDVRLPQQVYSLVDQFMVGDAVMVAPVVAKSATSVKVYLPAGSGRWKHVWTGASYTAPGWVTLPAPMGHPGVLINADSPWAARLQASLCGAAPMSCA